MDFSGLSAFPITPSNESGRVNTDELGRILDRLKDAAVNSVGLLGSTGTYAYLSRQERRRAVDAAAEALGGALPLMVGVGALRTDEACALARDAAEAGANGLLLAPVSYTPLTQEEAFQHYSAVAAASDLPLCIYNNPGTTHFSFGQRLLRQLARVPGIAAVKMPLPENHDIARDLSALRAALPSGFSVGYSGDWGCAEALLAGADTWYSVIGGLLPQIAAQLTAAARAGNTGEARRIDARLEPVWGLFREYGSLRVVYAATRLMGLTTCDAPRPILPLGPDETHRVAVAIEGLAG